MMNSYKKLIEELREHCLCITDGCNCGNCEGLLADKAYCRLQIELHQQAADTIEHLTYERHLIQQSLEQYDNNWLMDGDDVVLKIREILEGKQ